MKTTVLCVIFLYICMFFGSCSDDSRYPQIEEFEFDNTHEWIFLKYTLPNIIMGCEDYEPEQYVLIICVGYEGDSYRIEVSEEEYNMYENGDSYENKY